MTFRLRPPLLLSLWRRPEFGAAPGVSYNNFCWRGESMIKKSDHQPEGGGRVVSVNVSKRKGTPKTPVQEIALEPGRGVVGDAHEGPGDRQVSLLMMESISAARQAMAQAPKGKPGACGVELKPGSFAENVTTAGVNLLALRPGDELKLGTALIRVTRIGKECPRPCAIFYQTGSCIMPAQGVFGEVVIGGAARPGDKIETN